ncbi:unnamed protein product, partial [Musa hybrid cultivar]
MACRASVLVHLMLHVFACLLHAPSRLDLGFLGPVLLLQRRSSRFPCFISKIFDFEV